MLEERVVVWACAGAARSHHAPRTRRRRRPPVPAAASSCCRLSPPGRGRLVNLVLAKLVHQLAEGAGGHLHRVARNLLHLVQILLGLWVCRRKKWGF